MSLKPFHKARRHCVFCGKRKPPRVRESNHLPRINLGDCIKGCCCDTSWLNGKAFCESASREQFTPAAATFKLQTLVCTLGFNAHMQPMSFTSLKHPQDLKKSYYGFCNVHVAKFTAIFPLRFFKLFTWMR